MRSVVRAVVCTVLVVASLQPAMAQPSRPAAVGASGRERLVAGRVRRPAAVGGDSTRMGPAVNAWVTLHRVGKDTAGPVDSVRSDAAGRYRITWRPSGDSAAVYFAAVTWGGIAYFTAPLRSAIAVADEAEITVFDTTSRTFPLAIKGRHLIVGTVDTNDTRTLIEVFELSNDSLKTLVATTQKSPDPTWSLVIPLAALDVRVTQGEVAPDAFAHSAGRVSIFAPIAPGLKQIAFSYRLPAADFPINIRADQGAVVFEVLLEEEQGTARGTGFTAVEPVTIENRKFRRFLAQDVKPGGTVTLELPVTRVSGKSLRITGILVAIGFAALLLLLRAVQRRTERTLGGGDTPGLRRAQAHARVPEPPEHERLAHEIAALDATFARIALPSDSVRDAYHARRNELKSALADALASTHTSR